MVDSLLDAGVQEFRVVRTVEIAIQIGRVVQDLYIPLRCRTPLDEVHQWRSMALQALAIFIDAREHDGRNWKHDPGWRELALHEHVMNETAMKSAVAVLERMNVHEGKSSCRRLEDR